MPTPSSPPRPFETRHALWYLLLLAPFVGTLWVPFFNAVEPRIGGIPFFYWYQFVWIGISAVLTAVVYFATREPVEVDSADASSSDVER